MNYYLAKTDPKTYSIETFKNEGVTTWDGVRNPTAVKALKEMQKGDRVLIYHSQGECTIVGLGEVIGNSRPDPKDKRSWLVDFKFIKKFKEPFVTLQEIKQSGKFNDFLLVRQGRLSTMKVPENFVTWLQEKNVSI